MAASQIIVDIDFNAELLADIRRAIDSLRRERLSHYSRDPLCECGHSFNLHPIKSCMNAFCVCTLYRPTKR